ncbi:MAG: dienelactone hydrolase family protein [Anaerolineae bacterium]|nr:dienelactone hydrolase family protein [Anaerolineae bacterium]
MIDAIFQFIRTVFVTLVIVLLIALSAVIGIFGADAVLGPKAADFSNVTYRNDDGVELLAFFQQPTGPGPFPGVILAPDRRGLNAEVIRLAQWLAEDGYAVIVPDLYRGKGSATLPRELFLSETEPRDRMLADLNSAYTNLIRVPEVDIERIGLVGIGLGGSVALRYAVQNDRIKVIADAYGEGMTDADALGRLGGPLLAVFGGHDPFILPEHIAQFEAALKAADADYTLTIIPELGDDFLRLPDVAVIGRPANNAWDEIVAFLDATLQS